MIKKLIRKSKGLHVAVKSIAMKITCFRYQLKFIGKHCWITPKQEFIAADFVLGDFSFVGKNSTIYPKVKCGRFTLIAPNVSILGADHNYELVGKPIIYSGRNAIPETFIEDDVWIGKGATILVGTKIGTGSIVATQSVVTKDVPPFSIVAGIPAKVIGKRFSNSEDEKHHMEMLNKIRQPGLQAATLG